MPDSPLIRPYRGVAPAERVANRRASLIDAALEVFADDGWAALSARRVCERAGLARRYFYESFDDMDALIAAAFERISGEARAAVRAAVSDPTAPLPALVERAVSAALEVLAEPPAKGRFFAAAQAANSSSAYQADALGDLAVIAESMISAHRPGAPPLDPNQARITALMLVGAGRSVIDIWLAQAIDLSRDEVISWTTTGVLGIIGAVAARQR
jgi:AcrR family transcriptional regulator